MYKAEPYSNFESDIIPAFSSFLNSSFSMLNFCVDSCCGLENLGELLLSYEKHLVLMHLGCNKVKLCLDIFQ